MYCHYVGISIYGNDPIMIGSSGMNQSGLGQNSPGICDVVFNVLL
jgi:hypothetical protein